MPRRSRVARRGEPARARLARRAAPRPYVESVRDGRSTRGEPEVGGRRRRDRGRRRPPWLRPGGGAAGRRELCRSPASTASRPRSSAAPTMSAASASGSSAGRRGPRRARVLQRGADGGAVRRRAATARHQPVRVGGRRPPRHGLVDRDDARGQARGRARPRRTVPRRRPGRRERRALQRPCRLLRRRRAAAVRGAQGLRPERDDPLVAGVLGGTGVAASRARAPTASC